MSYTAQFLNAIESFPNSLAYFLLGLSAFVENLFPPIPGDTITAFGAFLVGTGKLSFLGVYLSTTIGSFFGFISLFMIGGFLGRHFFIEKDYRFLKAKDIEKAEKWFSTYGYFLIAFNRFLPGLRSAVSVAAGIVSLKLGRVALLSLISCGMWNLLWILLGFSLGTHWDMVEKKMGQLIETYNVALLVIIVVLLLSFLVWKKVRNRRRPTSGG
jgi:membrane protein DedA with SNARE-associated domain